MPSSFLEPPQFSSQLPSGVWPEWSFDVMTSSGDSSAFPYTSLATHDSTYSSNWAPFFPTYDFNAAAQTFVLGVDEAAPRGVPAGVVETFESIASSEQPWLSGNCEGNVSGDSGPEKRQS
jgi:hypothetical protein